MARPYLVQLTVDGETYTLERNALHTHPDAVHAALGTEGDEHRLQHYLDQGNVGDWYDDQTGWHLGPDPTGLELFWIENGSPIICLAADDPHFNPERES